MHLADFIWHYVNGKNPCAGCSAEGERQKDGQKARLCRINDGLQYIPIGTNQALTMGLLIVCLGNDSGHLVTHNYLKSGLLFQEPASLKTVLNDVGTYIRKCGIDLNRNSLTNGEVAALVYYDLMFGRSAFKTD
jgi:hypothetical protein